MFLCGANEALFEFVKGTESQIFFDSSVLSKENWSGEVFNIDTSNIGGLDVGTFDNLNIYRYI